MSKQARSMMGVGVMRRSASVGYLTRWRISPSLSGCQGLQCFDLVLKLKQGFPPQVVGTWRRKKVNLEFIIVELY